jgi:hypothetical protein
LTGNSRIFTSFTYPLPLYLAPVNTILAIFFILLMVLHPKRRTLDSARKAAGLPGTILSPPGEGSRAIIHASLAELEYPHVPNPNTVFAGPVLTPISPVTRETFPEIAEFLEGGRTVLVNLGSIFAYTEDDVQAVADGIVIARSRLADRGGFRVLWKLPQASKFSALLDERLGTKTEREGIRIEEWIDPPALAVLQHPNLAVAVHHGGASQFQIFTMSADTS